MNLRKIKKIRISSPKPNNKYDDLSKELGMRLQLIFFPLHLQRKTHTLNHKYHKFINKKGAQRRDSKSHTVSPD